MAKAASRMGVKQLEGLKHRLRRLLLRRLRARVMENGHRCNVAAGGNRGRQRVVRRFQPRIRLVVQAARIREDRHIIMLEIRAVIPLLITLIKLEQLEEELEELSAARVHMQNQWCLGL